MPRSTIDWDAIRENKDKYEELKWKGEECHGQQSCDMNLPMGEKTIYCSVSRSDLLHIL